MTDWTLSDVAYAALWLLVILDTVLLVALVRQVGILLLRVGQVAPARAFAGPTEGEVVRIPGLPRPQITEDGAFRRLLVFVSLDCGTCKEIVPAVDAVAKTYPEYHPVLIADAQEDDLPRWLKGLKLRHAPAVALPGILKKYEIPGTPFGCVVDSGDVVLASAGINHLDHIESLIRSCPATTDGESSSSEVQDQEVQELHLIADETHRHRGGEYDGNT